MKSFLKMLSTIFQLDWRLMSAFIIFLLAPFPFYPFRRLQSELKQVQSALDEQHRAMRQASEAATQWTAKRGDLARRIEGNFKQHKTTDKFWKKIVHCSPILSVHLTLFTKMWSRLLLLLLYFSIQMTVLGLVKKIDKANLLKCKTTQIVNYALMESKF